MVVSQDRMVRIGVFYAGHYFLHVSNYYNYIHPRKRRLSIAGLHNFIRTRVAELEKTEHHLCQIVDAHYFRGRLSAYEAQQRGDMLFWDRVFDDILMLEGVSTHYMPIKSFSGKKEEKGIDVWLALEAYQLAFYKQFSVVVLISSDGDYVPLIRKLNTLGTRVMLLSWDFEYISDTGVKMITRTSQDLLEEVTYPLSMHDIIDDRSRKSDLIINNLFVSNEEPRQRPLVMAPSTETPNNLPEDAGVPRISEILSIKNGYGFIKFPPNNLFFHYTSLTSGDFNELAEGDRVEFTIDVNEKGDNIAKNVRVI